MGPNTDSVRKKIQDQECYHVSIGEPSRFKPRKNMECEYLHKVHHIEVHWNKDRSFFFFSDK